jgi:hypothetical protein
MFEMYVKKIIELTNKYKTVNFNVSNFHNQLNYEFPDVDKPITLGDQKKSFNGPLITLLNK